MAKKKKPESPAAADPRLWSDQSRQSYAAHYVEKYEDIKYNCWRCRIAAVYSAEDQKHAFEVKKAYIHQQRILCGVCWEQSEMIAGDIRICEQQWKESKVLLKNDVHFLSNWLRLLIRREEYVPYRPNTAIKNMLRNLLE